MIHYTQRFLLVALLCLLGVSAVQAQAIRFTIQVEALDAPDPALELVEELRASGLDAYYVLSEVPGRGRYYRVRVGNFPNMTAARHRGEQLRRARVIRTYYVTHYERPVAFPNNIPSGAPAPAARKKAAVSARPAHPKQVRIVQRSGSHTCVGLATVTTWKCSSKRHTRPARKVSHKCCH